MGEANPAKKNSINIMGEANPAKKASILWGNRTSKERWQNCYGTLLDNFFEIDAIIGDIIFLWVADHILHPVREKMSLWGHC
jgi:hypothetical protein